MNNDQKMIGRLITKLDGAHLLPKTLFSSLIYRCGPGIRK